MEADASVSIFIYFRNTSLPKEVDLVHKLTHGYFDLQFKGIGGKLNIMRDKYFNTFESNMKILKAGKSAKMVCHKWITKTRRILKQNIQKSKLMTHQS